MMMGFKLTVLVENTVGVTAGILSEWGLATLLDFGDEQILFDTGEQGSLIRNAQALGYDLQKISRVVLSHGHYDHTGGLISFLKLRGSVPVYAHPELYSAHYEHDLKNGSARYIGVPYRPEQLESAGAQFIWQRTPMELSKGLWFSGEIERKTDFEPGDSRLVQKQFDIMDKDPFADDVSLFYETDKGLIIVLGCAHAGLVNIVEHARRVTGQTKIRAIVGGTHLGPAGQEQQERTIAYLHSLELECLAPNHCTGLSMAARLAGEFPAQFRWASAGSTLEF